MNETERGSRVVFVMDWHLTMKRKKRGGVLEFELGIVIATTTVMMITNGVGVA